MIGARGNTGALMRWCWILIFPALLMFSVTSVRGASDAKPVRVRMGLSDALFQDLNENDARAAVNAWAESLSAAAQLEVEGGPQLMSSEEIVHAISNRLVDGFSITTAEYVKVPPAVDSVIFTDESSVKDGLEYVLLVRETGRIRDVAALRGHSLLVYQSAGMSLAGPWLDTLLAGLKLETADRFFGRVKKSIKVAQTVLPVFFESADACLVTRQASETMCELNPQLRRRLLVLAVSPKLFAAFFGVQKDAPDAVKSKIRQALLGYYDTPGGRQILTLFQSNRLIGVYLPAARFGGPVGCLRPDQGPADRREPINAGPRKNQG